MIYIELCIYLFSSIYLLYHNDCLSILKELESESVDTIITDPPYGYSFMNKDWDKAVVGVDTWKECLRVLKSGSFAAVMSSPRQDVLSKMICNLQDAGFRTDFTSVYWTYASGFPKASNVSKLVDKRLGVERTEIIGKAKGHTGYKVENHLGHFDDQNYNCDHLPWKGEYNITKPASEEAKKLDGSYAGFQPKPAVEVILMVMKPLSEKSYVDQALSNSKGVTWLDDCRIPFQDDKDKWSYPNGAGGIYSHEYQQYNKIAKDWNRFSTVDDNIPTQSNTQGRFPANLLVSNDVLNDGKITKSSGGQTTRGKEGKTGNWGYNEFKMQGYGDIGSYSRYFDLDKWFDTTFPFLAVPKASSSEKNKGLELKNTHPTTKPLKLMSWLITLLSRPNDIILDPFMGSGTTCLAAKMLDRRWIGIEKEKEYYDIANQRLKYNHLY